MSCQSATAYNVHNNTARYFFENVKVGCFQSISGFDDEEITVNFLHLSGAKNYFYPKCVLLVI